MRMGLEMVRPSHLTVQVHFERDRPALSRLYGYSTHVLTGTIVLSV